MGYQLDGSRGCLSFSATASRTISRTLPSSWLSRLDTVWSMFLRSSAATCFSMTSDRRGASSLINCSASVSLTAEGGGAAGSGGAGGVPRSISWVSTGSQASGGVASAQVSDGSVVVLPSVAPRCFFSSASILFNKGLSLMGNLLAGGLTQGVCFQGIAARLIETVTGAALFASAFVLTDDFDQPFEAGKGGRLCVMQVDHHVCLAQGIGGGADQYRRFAGQRVAVAAVRHKSQRRRRP